jgi:hypothetical protein
MSAPALERVPTPPVTTGLPAVHMEPMTSFAATADRTAPISLAPGSGSDFTWLAGDALENLDVHRYETGDYVVCPSQTIDFTAMFGDEAAPDVFLDRHERLIEDFMREHYDAQMEGDGWDAQELECVAALPRHAAPTGTDVLNAALTDTAILRLRHDASAGLAALLAERIRNSVVVTDRTASIGKALRMEASAIDAEVSLRNGEREISDATAMAIARAFSSPAHPALSLLGRSGYALKDQLWEELRSLYEEHRYSPRLARRIDMMFTWALHGGEND